MSGNKVRISPVTGRKQFLNENNRWQNFDESSVPKAGASSGSDPRDDVSNEEPVTSGVSIFSDEFTDVLYERYDDDPREVDEERIEYMRKVHDRQRDLDMTRRSIASYQKYIDSDRYMDYQKDSYRRAIAKLEEKLPEQERELRTAQIELNKYNEENPVNWPQYWLVTGGHFHNSLGCSTLRPTTNVGLYSPASGMNQDEAIELAGSRVCTHCVPDAPVDIESRPSHVWTKEEKEEMEEKQRREEEKRKREEEKERKKREREQKAQEKQKALKESGDHFLKEEITVPSLNSIFSSVDEKVDNVDDLRKSIKDSFGYSIIFNSLNKQTDLSDEARESEKNWRCDVASNSGDFSEEKLDEMRGNIDKYWGTDKYWAISSCYGDIEGLKNRYRQLKDSVQILADTKGQTYDKTFNSLFGKRTMNTVMRKVETDFNRHRFEENYKELAPQRMEIVKGWINNPDSIDDFFS